ncbi:Bromodomain-containing protein [Phaeosphaeria sp. MPI-PUGE-AT-0046c]|nr:Bromodomain-containing protein [Phaeosphaeria sp. MPI-PUGE-AT-0046c]
MESAAKRKAASAAVGEGDGRPAKRQKVPAESNASTGSAAFTKTKGLQFLDSLKAAKDKTGRPIATHFLTLPAKNEVPGYYEHVKLPIAIDTIEKKLQDGEYPSLAQVESDAKRMVNNAKSFNDKKSIIYEDAERLRKTASNWMTKHNPSYKDQNYAAIATPIPGEENSTPGRSQPRVASTPRAAHSPSTPETADRPRRAAAATQASTPAPSKLRHSASARQLAEDNTDFDGKTFQQAQEQIVQELIDYVEPESGLPIFAPFVNLPSRSLKDYYALIKEPMSLAHVRKKVQGVVGRDQPTGQTLLTSWDQLEAAMSLIWKNARDYNEDGSEIHNVSLELEEFFNKRLAEAKAKVEQPPQPRVKLTMSNATPAPKQQLRLRLNKQSPESDRNTPGARSSATPGVIVDSDALQRQQRHVLDSVHGPRSSRASPQAKFGTPVPSNPFTGNKGATSVIAPLSSAQTKTAGSPPATNGVKQDINSPALSAIRPSSTAPDSQSHQLSIPPQSHHPIMAPPRPTSGSPYPNGIGGQHSAAANGHYQQPTYVPPTALRMDINRKVPLKSVDEALMPKITLNTHPALNSSKPWSLDIFAHKEKTEYSVTCMVLPTNSYLQITPNIPIALTNRLYRIFVSVNGNKTYEVNRVPVTAGINGSSPGPGYESGKKKGEPVFEAKLVGGVNRIEVELVAEKEHKGAPESSNPKDQIEVEKCTIYLNLTRQSSY